VATLTLHPLAILRLRAHDEREDALADLVPTCASSPAQWRSAELTERLTGHVEMTDETPGARFSRDLIGVFFRRAAREDCEEPGSSHVRASGPPR
jgi:hypothetical protein